MLYHIKTCIFGLIFVFSCSLSEAAIRFVSTPENIHIKYVYTLEKPILPKAFLDEHIKQLDKKIKEASGQPNGKGVAYTNKIFRQEWMKRYHSSPVESGHAEYWGTKNGMIWNNGYTAYAYNGRYVSSGRANDIVPTPQNRTERPEWLHVMPGTKDIDVVVPYLGFYQPGKEIFSNKAKVVVTGTRNGYEIVITIAGHNKKATKATYLIRIDKNQNIDSLIKRFGHNTIESYIYKNWCIVNSFRFPRLIEYTKYVPYEVGNSLMTAPYEVYTYRAIGKDTSHLDTSIFDVVHPPLGIIVQDWRYSSERHPDGIQYAYKNPKLTISEASLIFAKEGSIVDGQQSENWSNLITALTRVVSISVLLFVLFKIISTFRGRRAGGNSEQ